MGRHGKMGALHGPCAGKCSVFRQNGELLGGERLSPGTPARQRVVPDNSAARHYGGVSPRASGEIPRKTVMLNVESGKTKRHSPEKITPLQANFGAPSCDQMT